MPSRCCVRSLVLLGLIGCKHECEITGEWSEGAELQTSQSSQATWNGVATSSDVTCAWDPDQVWCWEDVTLQLQTDDPIVVSEMAISPAGSWAVALLEGGSLAWFDPARTDLGVTGTEQGPYKAMWAGSTYLCVVRDADDSVACGETSSMDRTGPEGVSFLRAVGDDQGHFCGLGIDRTVTCWDATGGALDGGFGDGRYASIDGARGQICAVPNDPGVPVCFGEDTTAAAAPPEDACGAPEGDFELVAVGDKAACALDAAGLPWCWTGNTALPAPEEAFATLSMGPNHACGLHTDGTLGCFGARSTTMQYLP